VSAAAAGAVAADRARILVVDDNPGYRRLVQLALEDDRTFEVVAEAASAEEAVAVASRVAPDVALVDVLLPGGEGFRLPSVLHDLVPSCTVVLTSAHPEGDLDAFRQLGGIAFLPKSVAPSRLGWELGALVAVLDQVQDVLQQAATELPASRDSPRAARRFVEELLRSWGREDLLDTVTLLVSELVGNAVVHAGSEVELTVRLIADRLRVDVVDHSTNVPHRRDAGEEDLTGRGSELVEILATSWGISGRPDGKSVWFEIALPADLP
jgi:DNA-binding NarL/FixJ family response regulator